MIKIACIQITSSSDLNSNINKVNAQVTKAAAQGAEFIFTPENSFLMEETGAKTEIFTQENHPAVKAASEMAKTNGVWLLIGSVAVDDGDGKSFNRSILFDNKGQISAYYDKIHLFDVEVGDGQIYRESAKITAGNKAVVAATPFGGIGMTVCYDVRFPQLYRALAKAGANIITVPAAFTQTTGEAHWHMLLRARAVETGCFIVAPAQTGTHAGGRQTYGHSIIIDPWGKILADAGTKEGIIFADLDLSEVKKTRIRLPSLQHDREFSV